MSGFYWDKRQAGQYRLKRRTPAGRDVVLEVSQESRPARHDRGPRRRGALTRGWAWCVVFPTAQAHEHVFLARGFELTKREASRRAVEWADGDQQHRPSAGRDA